MGHVRVTPGLRRDLEDAPVAYRHLVRALAARIDEVQEEERRRIAADLHDDPIQVVTAADLRAQALARRLEDPELRAEAVELHETLREATERLRSLLFELRPPALDREGLAAALRQYLGRSWGDGSLQTTVDDRLDGEPPPDVGATLFRIAQEAVANARKHARASRVEVQLVGSRAGIRLLVIDDGKGLEPLDVASPRPGHLGIPAMLERAELAGGWCRVDGAPSGGTVVECWLPFEPGAPAPPFSAP